MHAYLNGPSVYVAVPNKCRKVRFATRRAALVARKRTHQMTDRSRALLMDTGTGLFRPYLCDACKGWHVGHA